MTFSESKDLFSRCLAVRVVRGGPSGEPANTIAATKPDSFSFLPTPDRAPSERPSEGKELAYVIGVY